MALPTASPKLSILILTYNRKDMLADCLASVRPTKVDCEIVVLDDASTDGTAELLADYAGRDPRIRHYRQPTNVGIVANQHTALKEARGEFISILADDDSIIPGNYEKKAAILEAHPEVGLVYSRCYFSDPERGDQQNPIRAEYMSHSYIGGRDEFHDLITVNYIPGNSVMFRRQLYEQRGGFDPNVPSDLGDWDLWLRYTYQTPTAFINEPLVNVRMHSGGISVEKSSDLPGSIIAVWRKWLVDREDPPVLNARLWEGMRASLEFYAKYQPDKLQGYMAAFEQLRHEAAANASRHFARVARSLAPLSENDVSAPARRGELPTLVWSGPVFGLGEDSADLRATILAAERAGLRLRLEDVDYDAASTLPPVHGSDAVFRKMWMPLEGSDYIQVCHSAPHHFVRPLDARASVGRTAWATDRLPPEGIQACNAMHAVWVPTQFHLELFAQAGVSLDRLRFLPGCIDVEMYGLPQATASLSTGRSFNFLAAREWASGSGWDVLVGAFVREFRVDEDVALVLLTQPPHGQQQDSIVRDIQQVIAAQIGSRPSPVINLQLGVLVEQQMAGLLHASQAYVEPNRSASWGRSVMQAMASGLPTIATAWGGNLDVMTERNSYTLEYKLVDVPQRGVPDLPDSTGHRWAEPSGEHLQARLRHVFTHRQEAASRGQQARADVAAGNHPAVVGERLPQLVAEVV